MYRGSVNANAKLTEYRVYKIMLLWMTGRWTPHRLSIKERISRTEIRNILARRVLNLPS